MKVFCAVLCAILLAGANGATVVNEDAGGFYAFTITAFGHQIKACHLTTPAGTVMEFTPGVASQYGDRYELREILQSMPSCSVGVNNLQTSDNGVWEVAFVDVDGTSRSNRFDLTVTGSELEESEEITENENIEWLEPIAFPTHINRIIDISLPRIEHEEECIIRTPDKQFIEAAKLDINDVVIRQSSYFVSCRITIETTSERLLGEWAICGKYISNNVEVKRCQLANIFWNTETRPDADWHEHVQSKFDHPIHFDSELTPAVIGNGEVVSCHVVTPNGEDLLISRDSKYPSIRLTAANICSFAIGPLHQGLLGDWVIYGLFRNSIEGLHEEHLPLNMFLYDEENPYNQAYNVTVLDPVIRAVNLENTLNVEVSVSVGQVDSCYFITPSGSVYYKGQEIQSNKASFLQENDGHTVACRVAIGPITKEMIGDWKITGKFSNNGIYTERQQIFQLTLEDPENPIEEDRTIVYLDPETVNIEMGQSSRLVIPAHDLFNSESCHIRTPTGVQYQITKGFIVVPGIEVIEDDAVECGVVVTAVSEDVIGDWTLIARASHQTLPIERRLPFTIYVTESVEALQNVITLTEGDDLYVSLKYPTAEHETCKLIGPYGFECQTAVRDPQQVDTCGFIRRNVQSFNAGTWTITFGNTISYKAKIAVIVNAEVPVTSTSTVSAVRDRPFTQYVGPENAVYCRVEDPQGVAVFDSFGRCQLSLDKVGLEHQGTWKMIVAAPGRIVADEHLLILNVREGEGKPVVTTNVAQAKPLVDITCSVQSPAQITGCKFRNAQGKILIAASGLTEGRYEFFGRGSSFDSATGMWSHECGIRLEDPLVSDLGLWRCALDTAEETYYGHMPVLCPFALSNPANAALVQQEPILRATRPLVNAVESDPAVLSCSVESAIRYCYFRTANGTTFTVTPGMSSSSMEYVGAGFDAGECGIRFHGLNAADSGRWGCHVGLVGDHEEMRDQFQVTVHEKMAVRHFMGHGNVMTVEGIVYEGRALEYCRFVRMDGFGFTTDNMPPRHTMTGILANGECQFTTREASILEMHPWTIVAKIRGQDVEIAKDTMESLIIGAPATTSTPAPVTEGPAQIIIYQNSAMAIVMYVFMGLMLLTIILGVVMIPKRNRDRASAFRRSLSNSFKRQPREQPAPSYTP